MKLKMKIRTFFFLFAVWAVFLHSCSTDLDVNAPYKDITVVYGILNQNDSIHYIKINKAFNGEDNAFDMAKDRKLSEYENIDAFIERIDENGEMTVPPYTLQRENRTDKDTGIFYSPEQVIYSFYEPELDPNSLYRLNIHVKTDSEEEKEITAETYLVQRRSPQFEGLIRRSPVVGFTDGKDFTKVQAEWNLNANGRTYQLSMKFNYRDILDNGNEVKKSITLNFPQQRADKLDGTGGLNLEISGERFFQFVGSHVPPLSDGDGIKARQVGHGGGNDQHVEFILTIAGEELNTYMEVNQPSSGIGSMQEKPEYTNVENGIGIFSARSQSKIGKELTYQTVNELSRSALGPHTEGRGFCEHSGPCP